MGNIIRNLKPYWKQVLLVLVLLYLQAQCNLALPGITSRIIDTGILGNGVEYTVPDAVTEEEYGLAQVFMTEEEKSLWQSSYEAEESGERYILKEKNAKEREELDEALQIPLVMGYQMSQVDAEAMAKMSAASPAGEESGSLTEPAGSSGGLSPEVFSRMSAFGLTGVEKTVTVTENGEETEKTVYDLRKLFSFLQEKGMMEQDALLAMRGNLEATVETLGSTMLHSVGVAYADDVRAGAADDADVQFLNQALQVRINAVIGQKHLHAGCAAHGMMLCSNGFYVVHRNHLPKRIDLDRICRQIKRLALDFGDGLDVIVQRRDALRNRFLGALVHDRIHCFKSLFVVHNMITPVESSMSLSVYHQSPAPSSARRIMSSVLSQTVYSSSTVYSSMIFTVFLRYCVCLLYSIFLVLCLMCFVQPRRKRSSGFSSNHALTPKTMCPVILPSKSLWLTVMTLILPSSCIFSYCQ